MTIEELQAYAALTNLTNYIVEIRYCVGAASRDEWLAAGADLLEELATNMRSNIRGEVYVPARRDT